MAELEPVVASSFDVELGRLRLTAGGLLQQIGCDDMRVVIIRFVFTHKPISIALTK